MSDELHAVLLARGTDLDRAAAADTPEGLAVAALLAALGWPRRSA